MGMFDRFFGVFSPANVAPILAIIYAVIGLVFMILCFGGWIMPHAETDLAMPWAVVCLLLMLTGIYGIWTFSKGKSTWHYRQFVSACCGFFLMFLCWGIVYIAVEMNHVDKVNTGCMNRNPTWSLQECDDKRRTASIVATIMVTLGLLAGLYFTVVLSRWVSSMEWVEHLDEEQRLAEWRAGKGENPHEGEKAV